MWIVNTMQMVQLFLNGGSIYSESWTSSLGHESYLRIGVYPKYCIPLFYLATKYS